MAFSEQAAKAWERLPAGEWDEAAARHLLRRAAWTARPEEVAQAAEEGLAATLERLFPARRWEVPMTPLLTRFAAEAPELLAKARGATGFEGRLLQKELREQSQAALQEFRIEWLRAAAKPENAARAKWGLFLGDVYVVSAEKVRNPVFIRQHCDLLARHGFGPAPALTKAISRSPAMEKYLDLEQNRREAPNENFARELFELFVLGEGNYSEQDIKEAARAFTGYRVRPATGEFRFAPGQHDAGEKKVFGRTGRFSGDDVIELAYAQPAAGAFLPGELIKFYLTDEPQPKEYRTAIGEAWRAKQFDLRELARLFFGSRMFFAPEFRGNFIKSPIQFYLGLVQDLGLAVPPLARTTLAPLRRMGQELFQPPNVRGWVGGRMWINSATLAARRQVVPQIFAPLNEEVLNADEVRALAEARTAGEGEVTVPAAWSEARATRAPETVADELAARFCGGGSAAELRGVFKEFLQAHPGAAGVRHAAIAALQSPAYQLC